VASAHMKAAAKRDTYRDIGALSPCLQSFFIAADYTPARVKTQPACPGLQKRQSRTRALPEFGLSRLDQKLETEIDPVSERLRCR